MAKFSSLSINFFFLILTFLSITQLTLARKVPSSAAATPAGAASAAATPATTATAAADKKQTDCLQEGTVVIPGIGRYMVGSREGPALSGLDHSVPAAVNGQYLPGADDTFVPNPGFEIPNPFGRTIP